MISPTCGCLVMQWGPAITSILAFESLGWKWVELDLGQGDKSSFKIV